MFKPVGDVLNLYKYVAYTLSMLEIRLLKVIHETSAQAKKIEEHIRWADVYCPESAACSEETAIEIELAWENFLLARMPRAQARRSIIQRGPHGNAFYVEKRTLLHAHRKPMWHLERFSEEDSETYLAQHEYDRFATVLLVTHIVGGNLNECIDSFLLGQDTRKGLGEIRDREIARNLTTAQINIRRRYPALAEKEVLRLAIVLGSSHTPEKYCPIPLEIPPGLDTLFRDRLRDTIETAIASASTEEEKRLAILAFCAYQAVKRGKTLPRGIAELDRALEQYGIQVP